MLNQLNGEQKVISQNKAAEFWGLSINAVSKAMAAGHIQAQKILKLDDQPRPAIGFEPAYIKEVDHILPPRKQRGKKGKMVFTPDIVERLIPINKKWPTI